MNNLEWFKQEYNITDDFIKSEDELTKGTVYVFKKSDDIENYNNHCKEEFYYYNGNSDMILINLFWAYYDKQDDVFDLVGRYGRFNYKDIVKDGKLYPYMKIDEYDYVGSRLIKKYSFYKKQDIRIPTSQHGLTRYIFIKKNAEYDYDRIIEKLDKEVLKRKNEYKFAKLDYENILEKREKFLNGDIEVDKLYF